MSWLKDKIRNYLEIEPPVPQSVYIIPATDEESQIFINKIWYRGNAGELQQLYEYLWKPETGNNHFWGSSPTTGLKNIRKIHTGLPALIVDTLADISIDDLDEIKVSDRQEVWNTISKENNVKKLLKKAVQKVLWGGDGAFKWSYDPEISEYPIIEFFGADRVDFEYKRGRLTGIIFKTKKRYNRQEFMLHEKYTKNGIEYKLFNKDKQEVNLKDYDVEGKYAEVENKAKFMMALPFMIYESEQFEGRGKSIFDGKLDNFDAFDEVWSQWMLAVRKGQIKTYIPDNLLPRDPKTGLVLRNNDMDNDYIQTGSDMTEGAVATITTTQGQIQHEALLQSYVTALDLCLQGLISPSTLGIDVKKLDNAEAQREKEKTTLYKRGQIIETLNDVIKEIVNITFKVYDNIKGTAPKETKATPNFGGYANPSMEAQIETMQKAAQGGVMSTDAIVEEIWGDTKDDKWKQKEVNRIKMEKGIEIMDEPAINRDIDLLENEEILK